MLKSRHQTLVQEAGCDEAGRGCLAGPVFAAAVILPPDYKNKFINDSKQLTEAKRYALRLEIEREAISWSVAAVDHTEIDRINILNASFLAMHRAVEGLSVTPGLLLIDGNRFKPYPGIPHQCIIGGDGKYLSIAAASVLAKTYRDDLLLNLHEEFPNYGWKDNKGYGTVAHRKAILEYGPSPYHRTSFRLVPDQPITPF